MRHGYETVSKSEGIGRHMYQFSSRIASQSTLLTARGTYVRVQLFELYWVLCLKDLLITLYISSYELEQRFFPTERS